MLNSVSLMGRLVTDPVIQTVKKREKEITIARYRLAVERDYKEGEKRPVDFIQCKAFGMDALYAGKYFRKGDTVLVSGRIISESYQKEGTDQRVFFTGVQVHNSYLARRTGDTSRTRAMTPVQDGEVLQEEYPELPSLPEEEYPELPPLPEEDGFLTYGDIDIPSL